MIDTFVVPGPPARPHRADAPVHHVRGAEDVGARLGLRQRHLHQRLDRLVVDDLAVAHDPVMAVGVVGVERDVGHHRDLRDRLLDRADRAVRQVVGVPGLGAILGLQRRRRYRERGRSPGMPRSCGLARGLHDPCRPTGARRRASRQRFLHALAVAHEDRPDQVRTTTDVDFLDLVTEVIDLRSFSNLWYWIVLAILWSSLSHWTLGVPYHIVTRARRGDDRATADMRALAEINAARILAVTDQSAAALLGFAVFIATGLAVTGWLYRVEFLQAIFLLVFPAMLVGGLTVQTARKLRRTGYEDVARDLRLHRIYVQMLGVVCIFLTAFWGRAGGARRARRQAAGGDGRGAGGSSRPTCRCCAFPGWDCLPYDRVSPNPRSRRRAWRRWPRWRMAMPGPFVVLTTLNAATQRVPARAVLREAAFTARGGRRIDEAALRAFLVRMGFTRHPR
jgi:hypothetical protein